MFVCNSRSPAFDDNGSLLFSQLLYYIHKTSSCFVVSVVERRETGPASIRSALLSPLTMTSGLLRICSSRFDASVAYNKAFDKLADFMPVDTPLLCVKQHQIGSRTVAALQSLFHSGAPASDCTNASIDTDTHAEAMLLGRISPKKKTSRKSKKKVRRVYWIRVVCIYELFRTFILFFFIFCRCVYLFFLHICGAGTYKNKG